MIDLLTLNYSRARWSEILRQLFSQYEERQVPLAITPPAHGPAAKIFQLGTITLSPDTAGETKLVAVIEMEATDVVNLMRNRVGLRQTAAHLLSPGSADALLVVTTQPGLNSWRCTFISREVSFDSQMQLVRTETAPHRFTYLLGPEESCRTSAARFALLATHRSHTTLAHPSEAVNNAAWPRIILSESFSS